MEPGRIHLSWKLATQNFIAPPWSKDVTICVYRIVQESLRNVVKHSRTQEAKVELTGHSHEIDPCISDSGVGFDPELARGQTGLGLISMREAASPGRTALH